ncbi:MAG: hypothetical protein H0V30_15410 [Chitinophagaceae bacterium]|nr:hypothetical protein [Chitinophagaceae bacterium]
MDRKEKILAMLADTPGDSFLQHALALEYIKNGNDEEAKKLFETLLMRDPGYIGSYYHLAKLLERQLDEKGAIAVYEKGMQEAKLAGDQHAYNELRSAHEELTF